MSSQSRQPAGVESLTPSCTFCDCQLTENLLAIQSYPSKEASLPSAIPDDGGLTLCSACASEVTDLLTAWQHHGQPPVDVGPSIGSGYATVASACSFCTDPCEGAVLGVELYRRTGDEVPAYANYTLCGNCQAVFDEFLQNVRSDVED
jgi:hypothetical protein